VVSDPSWKFEWPQVVQNMQWNADLQRSREWSLRVRQEWVLAVSRRLLRQPGKGTRQEKGRNYKVIGFGVPHEVIE
jgi:hypothetical protein